MLFIFRAFCLMLAALFALALGRFHNNVFACVLLFSGMIFYGCMFLAVTLPRE